MKEDNDFLMKNKDFRDLAKKAKVKSNIRIMIVSFIVSLVVIFTTFYLGNLIITKSINKETEIDNMWNSIHGANIVQQGTSINYSVFTAESKTQFSKVVDGISIPWVPQEKRYSILGTSTVITTSGPSGAGDSDSQRIPMYYNGERATEFIHPKTDFAGFDDRDIISEMGDEKVIEVALSFDKGYRPSHLQQIFNDKLAWLWVDTYDQTDIDDFNNSPSTSGNGTTVIGDDAIGFRYNQDPETQYGAEHFINTLRNLKEKGDFQKLAATIIHNIKPNSENDLSPDNIEIIGVVVTGTPSELIDFIELPMTRGVFLGATVDKY